MTYQLGAISEQGVFKVSMAPIKEEGKDQEPTKIEETFEVTGTLKVGEKGELLLVSSANGDEE